ncbi:PAS domain-containing sensor histidine kinase [Streptomyces sclerotialus]|uniref:PAS domain-containing sensor histidine kinase n=1 Tax=Streptomyces sclerotialus TaxID=1957 RepID=UPI0004C4E485
MADSGRPGADDDHLHQVVVAVAADGILAVDEDGRVVLCNPAAEELFRRPADRLVGSDFGFPLVTGETTIDLMLPEGGTRVVEMRVTTALLEDRKLYVAALRDITRRRQTERALKAALERQNVIVAVAAHQLHNPLATIAVLVDLLRDTRAVLPDKKRDEAVERIAERTAHLQNLVRKLLTAARLDAAGPHAAPERIPVLPFLVERLGDIVERADEVRLTCPADLVAQVDRAAFAEMLANILENAFAYGRPPIEVRAAAKDRQWLRVSVRDHGDGVPEDFVPHLFKRFSRAPGTERQSEGTGLGLWVVRSLARANRGDAWYEPVPGGGACFRLRLPRAPAGDGSRGADPAGGPHA